MPIYEYVCTACDHIADILHGVHDPGPHFCPSCGVEGTMRKRFAPPAIHFKGSGWAKKDRSATSRSPKPKSDGGSSDSPAASGGDSGGDSGSGSGAASGSGASGASGAGGSDSAGGGSTATTNASSH